MSDTDKPRTIAFIHPDLGIGGAERLVVDAAVGLQRNGARVVVFTSHRDPRHCFDEARDGTLDVRVRGGWLVPRSVLGRLTIVCAILRQLHLLIHIYLSGELAALRPSHLVVDQLSAGLPLLQYLWPAAPILFYCHFPDLLLAHGHLPDAASPASEQGAGAKHRVLARSRLSALARLYRKPFDMLEGWSMGFATAIAVNSKFTKSVVGAVWPLLGQHCNVVYPCVAGVTEVGSLGAREDVSAMWPGEKVVLSINRFERKKDVGLAIRAFASIPAEKRRNGRLVIAGGYDPRVQENAAYHRELEALAESVGLSSQTHKALPSALAAPAASACPVIFLHSVPTASKLLLLRRASMLVYTPANEHFGIVPLEAMAAGLPVLAASSGGPTETVLDGTTGWLRDTDDPEAWADVMGRVVGGHISDADLRAMGRAGAARVRDGFERSSMAERFEEVLRDMEDVRRPAPVLNAVLNFVGISAVFGLGLFASKLYRAKDGR